MKILIFAIILTFQSLSAYCSEYAPISENIIACYGSSETEHRKFELVMMRYNRQIGSFPSWTTANDMLISFSGEKRTNGGSQGISQFNIEGSTELPENGEDWTYQSPEGTFFTAIGNLKGFMLYKTDSSEVKGVYYSVHEEPIDLECTSDPDVADIWIESIDKYKLF